MPEWRETEVNDIREMMRRLEAVPKEINAEGLKKLIKQGLYKLSENPQIKSKRSKDLLKMILQVDLTDQLSKVDDLLLVGQKISLFRQKYPDDPDLKLIDELYEDLKSDFDTDRKLKLDDGFEKIMELIEKEVAKSGVVEQAPDQSDIPEVISALRGCGIEPKYVVSNGRKSAKTVVYFMQTHPPDRGASKELLEAAGVEKSQKAIYDNLLNSYKAGLMKTVYGEGLPGGMEIGSGVMKDAGMDKKFSYGILKEKLGNKMRLVGMEDFGLTTSGLEGDTYRSFRVTAHNIFLASAIDADLKNISESLVFSVLGAAHEDLRLDEGDDIEGDDIVGYLPFSHALAYYGYNVVVVDESTKYLDKAALKKLRL